jgi:hypothetical protein
LTVESTINKSGPYAGAGSTGPFLVEFRFLDQTHLRVIKTSTAGVNSDLVLTTDYSVAGVGNPTGSVTLTAPLALGENLTIVRNVPATQEANYVQNDAFPAESHEDALDKATMLIQQLQERVASALALPPTASGVNTELPVPQANFLIGWNSSADGLGNIDPSTLAAIVAYGNFSKLIGSGDGSTKDFIASSDLISENNAQVHISGIRQRPGTDYTILGTKLSFVTAPGVGTNNILVVWGSALPVGSVSDASVTTPKLVDGVLTADTAGRAKMADSYVTTAKIADDAVTFAKTQNISTARVLGRSSAGTGDIEQLSLSGNLNLSGGVLSANPVLGTAVNTTSGTFVDLTGIPSWVKRITLMLKGVSTNGVAAYFLQLGAGSIDTSGYSAASAVLVDATLPAVTNAPSGFYFASGNSSNVWSGSIVLTHMGSNIWFCVGGLANSSTTALVTISGNKTLSGVLDRIRLTTVGGTDTFDAGSINILYE